MVKRKALPFFDKNYILKEAQASLEDSLLRRLVQRVKHTYLVKNNPLGLVDRTVESIQTSQDDNLGPLRFLYERLATLYRFLYDDNQLELLFNGKSHFENYLDRWAEQFEAWTAQLCENDAFLKTVLSVTVFADKSIRQDLLETRLRNYMEGQFGYKILQYQNVIKIKRA